MEQLSFEAGEGVYRVEATVTLCGSDLSVCLCGGDTPHIGAVALASPRMSLADKEKPSASASVICVTGHKEDELAREAALDLSTLYRCQVVVSAGIHIDNATGDDIKVLWKNYKAVKEMTIEGLNTLLNR